MLDPQASRFWQAALLSGLMDAQGLTACWEAIAPAKREIPEHLDRRLARQAVQQKALTLWQAQQLLAGRTGGFKVDRYVLLDLIGQGGMGRVYLARDTRLNREVALKILSPERVSNPRAIARFQREARVGAQLQHENLVRIYDFGESNGRYYLVMEYIEGKTIGTMISEQGQIPPATAVRLSRQVALGLEHAHRKGLIHRDVNPYNILITRDGTAKLADLGLAIDLADDDHVTREGATVGTFDYVAPEQARHSHSADIRSDIYSLGCTIYHMCSGQVPFPSPSLPEKLFAHQALEPTPLAQLIPGLPEGLSAVVQRMMRKSPDERFATPIQIVQVLEPFLDEPSIGGNRDGVFSPVKELVAEYTPRASRVPSDTTLAPTPAHPQDERVSAPVKMLAALDVSTTSPVPVTETSSAGNAEEPVPESPGPSHEHQASGRDFPLSLDLGLAPSLVERKTRPKIATASDRLRAPLTTKMSKVQPAVFWLWGLVGLTTMVMILVAVLAIVKLFNAAPAGNVGSAKPARDARVKLNANTEPSTVVPKPKSAIVVRTEGENDQEFPAQKMLEAMQTAMGARGWIELRNREPIRFTTDPALNFNSGRGRLTIRAAPGVRPVLEVEMTGSQPFLTTGSGVGLDLSGVTIKVQYPARGLNVTPPPVIAAAGSAKIDRCAFLITGGARTKGSRAIFSDGGVLDVNHSWFQGFDETIDVTVMSNTTSKIQQTMIVPASRPAQAQPPTLDWYGWAVRLQRGLGGSQPKNPQPHLILDHCTVDGAGLIDMTNSPGTLPVVVHVNYCAVKVAAMLACKQSTPASSQVRWQGKGNQYDILAPVWIVLSAHQGTPAFLSAVTDLQSWLHFAPEDRDVVPEKLIFMSDAVVRTTSPQPITYKIQDQAGSQAKPGADPVLVGPWSSP